MDSDRVKGALKKKGGEIKEGVGKMTGDEKLKRSGQSDQIRGGVQNTVGGVKDALHESDNKSRDKD